MAKKLGIACLLVTLLLAGVYILITFDQPPLSEVQTDEGIADNRQPRTRQPYTAAKEPESVLSKAKNPVIHTDDNAEESIIIGRLVGTDGVPIKNAKISLTSIQVQNTPISFNTFSRMQTENDGEFRLNYSNAGTFRVLCRWLNSRGYRNFLQTEVTLVAGVHKLGDLVYTTSQTVIKGTVLLGQRPLAGCRVSVSTSTNSGYAKTDDDGRFNISIQDVSGYIKLILTSKDAIQTAKVFRVADLPDDGLRINLEPAPKPAYVKIDIVNASKIAGPYYVSWVRRDDNNGGLNTLESGELLKVISGRVAIFATTYQSSTMMAYTTSICETNAFSGETVTVELTLYPARLIRVKFTQNSEVKGGNFAMYSLNDLLLSDGFAALGSDNEHAFRVPYAVDVKVVRYGRKNGVRHKFEYPIRFGPDELEYTVTVE